MSIVYYRMTPRGRQRLTDREGKRLLAYLDSRRVWTIGVGHAATAGTPPVPVHGMRITAQECDDILTADLLEREKQLSEAIHVPVADHEFDALLSIFFNVGPNFLHSTALRELNAGNRVMRDTKGHVAGGCAAAIMMWKVPPEVVGRRYTEQSQFLTPYALGT